MQHILWADQAVDTAKAKAVASEWHEHLIPSQLDTAAAAKQLDNVLHGCDDGELFLECCQQERLVFGEGKVKASSNSLRRGMGLRAVDGESCYFSHASTLSAPCLKRLAEGLKPHIMATKARAKAIKDTPKHPVQHCLYQAIDPAASIAFADKIDLMRAIDAKARQHPYVQDVTITLQGEWQAVSGLRPRNAPYHDVRPRCELSISLIMRRGDKRSSGGHAIGGREDYQRLVSAWPEALAQALGQAERMLEAVAGPAGMMDVVLGAGWPGILLHEAIGHGLEADFNRKQTSVFSHLLGRQIAHSAVTIVDQGNIPARRGSLHLDDEGTPTRCTTLIEQGVLVGYMQDRLNARLMQQPLTGNGRRQSYQHVPMPRMTNTYMLAGNSTTAPDQAALIAEVKHGIFACNFGGGSVDITSGQFVFNCTEAYMIENGKLGAPINGASLIGMGANALKGIRAVGNDLALDQGSGMCGKNGQWVPVGVGQPSLLIGGLQVGGSKIRA